MTVLVVRLGALGDIVHTIPAAAAVRRAFPKARIDWLVDRKHREIVDLVTVVDRVIAIDSETLRGWADAVRVLRQTSYTAAIDFQGLLKSAVLARASGAERVVGCSIWHLRERTARSYYSTTGEAEEGHVILERLRLLRALGVNSTETEFPVATPPSDAVARIRERIPSNRPFAVINPGAAWPSKRWSSDRFGAVAAFIDGECSLTPVVVWGPGEEPLAHAIVAASSGAAIAAPRTSVTDLVALMRAASLVISGDSGPLHIATAVGTRVVAIFGPTNPAWNGPHSAADVSVSRHEACGCRYDRRCHQPASCLTDISVAEVCAAVQRRLRSILTVRE